MGKKQFIRKFQLTNGYAPNGDGTYEFIGYDKSEQHTIELKGSPKAIDYIVSALLSDGFLLNPL